MEVVLSPRVPGGWKMKLSQWLMIAVVLSLLSAPMADAEDTTKSDSLSPEKTKIIYDTLLPSGKAAKKSSKSKNGVSPQASSSRTRHAAMTVERVLKILKERDITSQGKSGQWEFSYEGRQVFLLADSEHNRIRLVTPVVRLDLLRQNADFKEVELLQEMLASDYLATGDVRFCLNNHIIWVAFLHPLDSLNERDLLNALEQLVEVAQKTRESNN
jgi:hypothetical protein